MNEVFRPAFGRGLTLAVAVIAVASAIIVGVSSGLTTLWLTLPWLALLVTLCWACFWRPSVVVSDAGVRLVNVTRTIDVPWPAMREVDTRFALTLETAYGRFRAWAAPAPGAGTALRSSMRLRASDADSDEPVERTTASMGDIEGTPSGDAAVIVRRRWEQLRDGGFLDDPQLEFDEAPMAWHWGVGGAVVALLAVSVATLFAG